MPDPKNLRLTERGRHEELLRVAEQAAAWLIELEDGGPRERAAFARWLEESPLHVEMFLRANSVDRMMELMEPADVKALAQRNWDDVNTVTEFPRSLDPPRPAFVAARPKRVYKARFAAIAAAVLVLVGSTMWYEILGPGAWDVQQTHVGEQRIVQLADGSIIYVNTDSRLEVHYTEAARYVRLRDGEALFKVAHDVQRPFRVLAGDSTIQAIGTQFNVYRRSSETKVAVVEGIVQVSKGVEESAGAPPARDLERLTAGQGLVLGEDGAPKKPVAVNIDHATAWRQRRLVFEWQTLEEIAAEFNRYNRSPQIRVEGDEVRKRRFTAVFDADNPQTLLKFLSRDDHIQFAAEGDNFVIRSR
ncbi:FecR family protein [Peristeroidobacter soli]|uniref:FecR family protein n=1 Tax=Peristeroidobacter soli TaxID=2497877 RepID=UPI00158A03E9|nr:FecR domain-containing protein [Peristeroidobacter soli]